MEVAILLQSGLAAVPQGRQVQQNQRMLLEMMVSQPPLFLKGVLYELSNNGSSRVPCLYYVHAFSNYIYIIFSALGTAGAVELRSTENQVSFRCFDIVHVFLMRWIHAKLEELLHQSFIFWMSSPTVKP